MTRPCGAIDCGDAVFSTNDCKTFRSVSVVTDFLTTKSRGGGGTDKTLRGVFKNF